MRLSNNYFSAFISVAIGVYSAFKPPYAEITLISTLNYAELFNALYIVLQFFVKMTEGEIRMNKTKLPKIIEALFNPKIYPHPVKKIELVQTHISYILLTGDFVYKIKKPVNFGFLDYTTLEKRKAMCEREVVLNRRLCPEAYLGIVLITEDEGKISLGGKGRIVEYAVKMKYLPAEKMLNSLLQKGGVSKKIIGEIAKKLAEFHKIAETNSEINQYGNLEIIKTNTEENFSQTEKYIGRTITQNDFKKVKSFTRNFIENNISLFEKRIRGGKIRDCHGDLQAAHVCLTDGICVFDCIEFNERFRYGDVASEIASLAMDLDFLGFPNFSNLLVKTYVKLTDDQDLLKIFDFYKCYRAYVRGKVESFKLDDPHIPRKEKEKLLETAKKYFKLALFYTLPKIPSLIIMAGLPGTGKSTVAKILAKKLGVKVISSDVVRKKLANIPLYEHRFKKFEEGIYAKDFSRRTYGEVFRRAEKIIRENQSVILDATFQKKEERQKAKTLAKKLKVGFLVIECILPENIVKEKMRERFKKGAVSDANWEIYLAQKKVFEEINEIPSQNHLIVNTSKPFDEKIIQKIKEKISENRR